MQLIGEILALGLFVTTSFLVARRKVRRYFEESGGKVAKVVYDPNLMRDGIVFTVYYTDNSGIERTATAKVGYIFFVSDVSIVADRPDDIY